MSWKRNKLFLALDIIKSKKEARPPTFPFSLDHINLGEDLLVWDTESSECKMFRINLEIISPAQTPSFCYLSNGLQPCVQQVSMFEAEFNIPLWVQFLIPSNACEENKYSKFFPLLKIPAFGSFQDSSDHHSGLHLSLRAPEFCPISDFIIKVLPDLHSTSEDSNHFYSQLNEQSSAEETLFSPQEITLFKWKKNYLVLINNGACNTYNLQQGPWRKTLLLSNYFSKMIHRIKIPITAT